MPIWNMDHQFEICVHSKRQNRPINAAYHTESQFLTSLTASQDLEEKLSVQNIRTHLEIQIAASNHIRPCAKKNQSFNSRKSFRRYWNRNKASDTSFWPKRFEKA